MYYSVQYYPNEILHFQFLFVQNIWTHNGIQCTLVQEDNYDPIMIQLFHYDPIMIQGFLHHINEILDHNCYDPVMIQLSSNSHHKDNLTGNRDLDHNWIITGS